MKKGSHDYMEKCPYCDQYMTSEQAESHVCDVPLRGIAQIPIMYLAEVKKENGDVTFHARGYDGILYRLCKTKHPMKSIRRLFTGDESDADFTEPVSTLALKARFKNGLSAEKKG